MGRRPLGAARTEKIPWVAGADFEHMEMATRWKITDSDRRLVRTLARHGVRMADIADELSCDVRTLRRHFRAELAETVNLKCAVTVALARRAERGDVRAVKLWFQLQEKQR